MRNRTDLAILAAMEAPFLFGTLLAALVVVLG